MSLSKTPYPLLSTGLLINPGMRLNMTKNVDLEVKHQYKQTNKIHQKNAEH